MEVYDIYGIKMISLEEAKEDFENIINDQLEARMSSYKGLYYSKGMLDEENYILQSNFFEEEGWTEPDYQDYCIILYISRSLKANELRQLLLHHFDQNIVCIRRVVITPEQMYFRYKYVNGKDELVESRPCISWSNS